MKMTRVLAGLLLAFGLLGCASYPGYQGAGAGNSLEDDGYGFGETFPQDAVTRPGMRSGDVRDPNVFMGPPAGRP